MNVPASKPMVQIRRQAQENAALLPPLLVQAQRLAAAVVMGTHGRRQTGQGEEFWQFRNALPGDNWRGIDWRRSARTDTHYVRQLEWQAAQSVLFWLDGALSMTFSGASDRPSKGERASVLGLAVAVLALRAGERAGLIEDADPPRAGQTQIERIHAQLSARDSTADYGTPPARILPKGSQAVFISDFLGDWAPVRDAVLGAADRGVNGALVQVLDPDENTFPFDGRTEFLSMSGAIRFESLRARGLKDAYLGRLRARREALQSLAAQTGWRCLFHQTSQSALPALMWLYQNLKQDR